MPQCRDDFADIMSMLQHNSGEHILPQPSNAALLEPGQFVRHPGQPDWGEGQVQSVVGERVTVNFEHAGKVLINARVIALEVLAP
jgi:Protein of unknown function (DUF3553)